MHLILSLLPLLLFGFKPLPTITHFQGYAHTHPYHIQIGHILNSDEKASVNLIIDDIFETIDIYYNHWNPLSELSQINQLPIGENWPISPQLFHLIQEAKKLTKLTEGHFDPTYGSVISLWKKALKDQTLPLASSANKPIGWNTFSFEKGKATKLVEGATIDLDGFLKGFAIDQIIEKIHQKGFRNIYAEWGGDIRTLGHHPTGRNWIVDLPAFNEETPLFNLALATSGNEYQSRKIKGKRYSHIIIPETKQALPSIETVSVKAPSCLFADALATALMTYPSIKAALIYLNNHKETLKECTIWLTTLNGEIKKWEPTTKN